MSDPLGKPKGSAVLKTLPEDQQQEIIDRIKKPKATYREVRAWLLMDRRITTSETALRDFWSWWHLRQRFLNAGERRRQIMESRSGDPSVSLEAIEDEGQAVFLTEAIEAGGSEGAKAFSACRACAWPSGRTTPR